MKICIASDFHLSYRQYGLTEREQDFYNQYHKLIDHITDEKPDIFLILGDIFDTPYPKPISIHHFEKGLSQLQDNGIKTYGIIGNHTIIQRKNYYPIDKIFYDKYTLLNEDYIITDDNTFIGGIPYHPKTYNLKGSVDALYEKSKDCKLKVLLLHQILEKDQAVGFDFDEDELGLDRFDYVFLGHFHKRLTRNEGGTVFHYTGSLNSCNVVELMDEMNHGKGYTVFDTGTRDIVTVNLSPSREYIEYSFKDDELNDGFVEEAVESLRGYDVKPIVLLKSIGGKSFDVYDMGKKLEKDSLIVKCKTLNQSYNDPTPSDNVNLSNNIEDMIRSSFKEKWKGDCAIDIFHALSDGDVESAMTVADNVFRKEYAD